MKSAWEDEKLKKIEDQAKIEMVVPKYLVGALNFQTMLEDELTTKMECFNSTMKNNNVMLENQNSRFNELEKTNESHKPVVNNKSDTSCTRSTTHTCSNTDSTESIPKVPSTPQMPMST